MTSYVETSIAGDGPSVDRDEEAGAGRSAGHIAIVGRAGRFPGAPDVATFWRNLRDGVESVRPRSEAELRAAGVPAAALADPNYVRVAATLDDVDGFDAPFFGMSPLDAAIMDPQHRHFLECAWEALEDAGHAGDRAGLAVGVFGGCGPGIYLFQNVLTNPDLVRDVGWFLLRHTGNDKDFLTTRVSYEFDLKGPSVCVQTACSTSLVAVHLACQSLLAGECDLALAGGVTIELPHGHGYVVRENEILSPDGHCRAFDADARGTVFGSGVGVVVLRRLDDALADGDTVHAVILGSAVNNDGALKAGYLAPSVDGQTEAVAEALAVAGVSADSVTYVETHGTGTAIGDPIEVAALTNAFRRGTDRRGFCGIGSVKTNVGHLDTAAGVASLIKVVEALRHRALPPSLHFRAPNPHIDFGASPFYVNAALRPWASGAAPRRAGVNSLGVGGTNAHVVLEEAPPPPPPPPAAAGAAWQLLVLSGRSDAALDRATARLAAALRENPAAGDRSFEPLSAPLADFAWTLQVGRRAFPHRRIAVCRNTAEARAALEPGAAGSRTGRTFDGVAPPEPPSVVFLFPGASGQQRGLGAELYAASAAYREAVDECLALAPRPLVDPLRRYVCEPAPPAVRGAGDDDPGERGAVPFVAVFVVELALARLLASLGVRPHAVGGHSLGEYTAAVVAGALDVADALGLVVRRAELFARIGDEGGMLAVALPPAAVLPLLGDGLDLALVNAPDACVVSGRNDALLALEARLRAADADCRRLRVPTPAHSALLDPLLPAFRQAAARVSMRPPALPFASGLSGTWMTADDAADPDFWGRHLRQTVRFADVVRTLAEERPRLFLEVGPGRGLTGLVRGQTGPDHTTLALTRAPGDPGSDVEAFLVGVGRAWTRGVAIDWRSLHATGERRRVSLPTYPFEHRRHWVEPGAGAAAPPAGPVEARSAGPAREEDSARWFFRPEWERARRPTARVTDLPPARWLLFADEGALGDGLARRLQGAGQDVVSVRSGERFDGAGPVVTLRPDVADDYARLLGRVFPAGGVGGAGRGAPLRVVHAWCAGPPTAASLRDRVAAARRRGIEALRLLAAALAEHAPGVASGAAVDGIVLTRGATGVDGEPLVAPEGALLHGIARVIPRELPELRVRCVDLAPAVAEDELVGDDLLAELAAASGDARPLVALRPGARWSERFAPVVSPAPSGATAADGAVIITGGLGGVGLVAAGALATEGRAALVLVGRRPLPPREAWDAWLLDRPFGDPIAVRIRSVLALERAGAAVVLEAADITDPAALRGVWDRARERFGRVAAVVHAAGVIADGPLLARSREDTERVLAPKVDGVVALDEALDGPLDEAAPGAADRPDRIVLFSSTSARLGLAGQADYAAANAFLDAWACSRGEAAPRTLAIDWGAWCGVGMTAHRAGEGGRHPLLGGTDGGAEGGEGWSRTLSSARDWEVDEHRLASGRALLPGTALLEIVLAGALAPLESPDGREAPEARGAGVELRDVVLLAPFTVDDGSSRALAAVVLCDASGARSVRLTSPAGPGREPTEHARAAVAAPAGAAPAPVDLAALAARLGPVVWRTDAERPWTRQQAHLRLGGRWRGLASVRAAGGEALARLVLPPEYGMDLARHPLHPALLDIAIHVGLPLVAGYEETRDLFVPLAWARVRWHRPLEAVTVAYVRSHDDNRVTGRTLRFDATLCAADGAVLCEVEGFTVRRVDATEALGGSAPDPAGSAARLAVSAAATRDPSRAVAERALEGGISTREGARVFRRLFATAETGALVVSPLDPRDLLAQLDAPPQRPMAADDAAPRSPAVAASPRTPVERELAAMWRDLLGITDVGADQDFFELGGQSLVAVRLFARIKKRWGLDLPLATLFEAPTVAACARIVQAAIGEPPPEEGADPAAEGTPSPAAAAVPGAAPRFQSLVPIQPEGSGAPFFCVAGMGGTTLNLRRLALLAGRDRPFLGLQPRGLDGKGPRDETVEDMAAHYLSEVRQVRPHGPYLLGGYSGGGIVAFEMARRLEAAGEEVAALVFLDSFSPQLPRRTRLARTRIHVQRALDQGPGYVLETLRRRYRYERGELLRRLSRPLSVVKPYELRYQAAEDRWLTAADRYRPEGALAAGAILFRAERETSLSTWTNYVVDEAHGWRRFVEGGVVVHRVPGDHSGMCEEPHVHVLAAKLRAALDAAAGRG